MRWDGVFLAIIAFITPVAAGLILVDYAGQGPVILHITDEHGVHAADLVVVALWLASVALLLGLQSLMRRKGITGIHQSPRHIHDRAEKNHRRPWVGHASKRHDQGANDIALESENKLPGRSVEPPARS